jgi:hypothetical protein
VKNRNGALPFRIDRLGRWWGKTTRLALSEDGKSKLLTEATEIDIVAVDAKRKNYILAECKHRNAAMDVAELVKLQEKSSFVKSGAAVQYMLFSKSGFAKRLAELTDDSVQLYTLAEILSESQKSHR